MDQTQRALVELDLPLRGELAAREAARSQAAAGAPAPGVPAAGEAATSQAAAGDVVAVATAPGAPDGEPDLSRSERNITEWMSYLPAHCVDTMIAMGWDIST
jgi:hypothetical protein